MQSILQDACQVQGTVSIFQYLVPRTYSSLVRAPIKLQIIIPSRFRILESVDQTDKLMRACRQFILFLRKREEDSISRKLIIKIEDEVIDISSDIAPENPRCKKKRKKAKHVSEEAVLERSKKKKREATDGEAAEADGKYLAKTATSTEGKSTHGGGRRRVSDQALLQKHLQDTEEDNAQLRALLEANGIGRVGVTMGLLRIKNGYTAESALHGL